MATYTKLPLSASVNGQQILVAANTSGSATPIHTAVAGTTSYDEIWLYAYNESTSSILTSILWGGTSEPNNVNRITVGPQLGRLLIADGKLLQNGLTVSAYSSIPNVILVDGFINRIS
jgi:hypothetical protein